MHNKKVFQQNIIDFWPEIFNDIKLNVVPLNYVYIIEIKFHSNKIWEIKLTKNVKDKNLEKFENDFQTMIDNYQNEIKSIDFKLDTVKIKKDVTKLTNKFLKNKRLT